MKSLRFGANVLYLYGNKPSTQIQETPLPYRKLKQELIHKGHQVTSLSSDEVNLMQTSGEGKKDIAFLNKENHKIDLASFSYAIPVRIDYYKRLMLEKVFGKENVFNSTDALMVAKNKAYAHLLMELGGVKSIPTVSGKLDNLSEYLKRHPQLFGEKVIIKLPDAHRGEGVIKCHRNDVIAQTNLDEMILKAKKHGHEILLQPYIPEASTTYRVLVTNLPQDKSPEVISVARFSVANPDIEFRSNVEDGGEEKEVPLNEVPSEIIEQSILASKALKMPFTGLDVVHIPENTKGPLKPGAYVIEANYQPAMEEQYHDVPAKTLADKIDRIINLNTSLKR